MGDEINEVTEGTDIIWLNGEVCLMAFSDSNFGGDTRLDCNYNSRDSLWKVVNWEGSMTENPGLNFQYNWRFSTDDSGRKPCPPEDSFLSYQLWDMSECPAGKFKRNHKCENIASNSCGVNSLGRSKVMFMDGCSRGTAIEEQSRNFDQTGHSGFYLSGKTCFATHSEINYRAQANVYCNFKTSSIYVQSSDDVRSYRV